MAFKRSSFEHIHKAKTFTKVFLSKHQITVRIYYS